MGLIQRRLLQQLQLRLLLPRQPLQPIIEVLCSLRPYPTCYQLLGHLRPLVRVSRWNCYKCLITYLLLICCWNIYFAIWFRYSFVFIITRFSVSPTLAIRVRISHVRLYLFEDDYPYQFLTFKEVTVANTDNTPLTTIRYVIAHLRSWNCSFSLRYNIFVRRQG